MANECRILIADDHEMVLRGLRSLIDAHEGWTVCGEARSGREAVHLAAECTPDIAILDMAMPGLNGLDATRQILKLRPDTEVLVLTMHESEQLIHEVLEAGAHGFVLKTDAGTLLVEAIECLSTHRPFFTSKASEVLLKTSFGPAKGVAPPRALTPREREMVQLIAEGKSTKEIAAVLGISVKTSETHRSNLMRKLRVHSVSEIVRYAIRNRMIDA